jgi:hypothetical protein
MTHSTIPALLGPEFDAFLFASVDPEGEGASLSVLSALARLDVDPWREAAELARMPREVANQRLTSLIAALPDAPAARLRHGHSADAAGGLDPLMIKRPCAQGERHGGPGDTAKPDRPTRAGKA